MRNHFFRLSLATKSVIVAMTTAVTLLLAPVAQAQNSKAKPVAVISVNSIDQLFKDADFLGSLVGQPQISAQYGPMLKGFTPGLDHSKPIGLVVQSDGIAPSGSLCLPVADLNVLAPFLKNFGVMSEDKGDGNWEFSFQGQTLVGREGDGWVFLSMPGMLGDTPADPQGLFGALTNEYDLGVRLHVQNIPEAFKQMALSQVEEGMRVSMKKLGSESDEQFEARKQMTELQVDQFKQLAEDLDEVTVGIAIDGEQQRTYLDFVYTAVAGSKLAEQLALNNDPKTDFAGFFQPDAAMTMSFTSEMAEADIAQAEQMLGAASKQIEVAIEQEAGDLSDEEREVVKSAVGNFMEAVKTTLQVGKIDGGAVLNVSPNSLSFVGGAFVATPHNVEDGLKKLVELAEKEDTDFPGVNWNASTHDDVKFHTLSVPIPADGDDDEEKARQLFGDTVEIAVGIGQESVYFALGRDCVDKTKEIIDASTASPQKSVPPMEMSFSLSQILETVAALADEEDKADVAMMASMLATDANGRDHVRILVEPISNGVRARIEAEEGILRAIGMGAMAAQMEAAGAAGAGAGF